MPQGVPDAPGQLLSLRKKQLADSDIACSSITMMFSE